MKKSVFFLLVASGLLLGKDIVTTGSNTITLDISNKSENVFIFKEPIKDGVFSQRQGGLVVKRNSANSDREFIISFQVGNVYEMSQDQKTKVLVGEKFADTPADIIFFGEKTKNKYVFRLNPVNNIDDLIFNVNHSELATTAQKHIKENIYQIEKKDSYRDLIISNQKNAFKYDKDSTLEKFYKKQAVNKIALDDDKQTVIHLSRNIGASYIQDIYEIRSKVNNLAVGGKNLYEYISLPPTQEPKRAISVLMNTVLDKGETTILAITKDSTND